MSRRTAPLHATLEDPLDPTPDPRSELDAAIDVYGLAERRHGETLADHNGEPNPGASREAVIIAREQLVAVCGCLIERLISVETRLASAERRLDSAADLIGIALEDPAQCDPMIYIYPTLYGAPFSSRGGVVPVHKILGVPFFDWEEIVFEEGTGFAFFGTEAEARADLAARGMRIADR